jgi:hypothetical protein
VSDDQLGNPKKIEDPKYDQRLRVFHATRLPAVHDKFEAALKIVDLANEFFTLKAAFGSRQFATTPWVQHLFRALGVVRLRR